MSNALDDLQPVSPGRRRRFTAAQKRALLDEAARPGNSVSETARRHGISPSLLFKWKRVMDDATDKSLKANERVVPESEAKKLKARIREFERMLGKKTMEVEILQEAVAIAREKSGSRATARPERSVGSDPYRCRARDLEAASVDHGKCRAEVSDPLPQGRRQSPPRAHPTCGYRRVTAHLNRQPCEPRVNHKRVYRVMRAAGLLLPKYASRPNRAHTGRIVTLASDMRWCSDSFEIRCWNGERVHVAFSLDCCDREAIGWVAANRHLDGQDIRDLIALSVESRFGTTRAQRRLEWLTDNGGPYVANETRAFASASGLLPRNTPAYSPESNGMAEAFVRTIKRDYVYVADLPDAATVLKLLPRWLDDYNENQPHKGLNMQSPRQFRRLNTN